VHVCLIALCLEQHLCACVHMHKCMFLWACPVCCSNRVGVLQSQGGGLRGIGRPPTSCVHMHAEPAASSAHPPPWMLHHQRRRPPAAKSVTDLHACVCACVLYVLACVRAFFMCVHVCVHINVCQRVCACASANANVCMFVRILNTLMQPSIHKGSTSHNFEVLWTILKSALSLYCANQAGPTIWAVLTDNSSSSGGGKCSKMACWGKGRPHQPLPLVHYMAVVWATPWAYRHAQHSMPSCASCGCC